MHLFFDDNSSLSSIMQRPSAFWVDGSDSEKKYKYPSNQHNWQALKHDNPRHVYR
jgi:hypothetical protein